MADNFSTKRIIDLPEQSAYVNGDFVATDNATNGTKRFSVSGLVDAAMTGFAPLYDATKTYAVGDFCVYNGTVYECTTAITTAEAWTAAHWTQVDVTSVLTDLNDAINDISAVEGYTKNILNPALLGTGTVGDVTISRIDDVFTYNGTASNSHTIDSQYLTFLEVGKTYTAKTYTTSTKRINNYIRFFNAQDGIISTIVWNSGSDLNQPHTFTVPENTVKARFNIGVVGTVPATTYSNDQYKFSIEEGSTNETYEKYGEILTATDNVARSRIDNILNEIDIPCYVSTAGSDSASGTTPETAFATIQHAIDSGYKKILVSPGSYKNQTVNINNKNGISIICKTNQLESNLFESHNRQARAKIDNSIAITDLTSYNSIYRTALTVDNDSSYYKVFIDQSQDPVYAGSDYYGRVTTYNAILWEITDNILTCTRLKPVLSVAACEAEEGTFTFDGDYLYINPTDGDIAGKTYNRLNIDTNTSITRGFYVYNSSDIYIEGIDIQFFPYYDFCANLVGKLTMRNCGFYFTCYGSAAEYLNCNGDMYECTSAQAGADGFGIASCGDTSFYNCNAINCYDDGISHHDGATGVIDGGKWINNYKGGVTPSFGSNVTVNNVYAEGNVYGIYLTQSGDRITDAVQFMKNCVTVNNTTKDIKVTGYDVISSGCCYGTKEVDVGATLTEYSNTVIS